MPNKLASRIIIATSALLVIAAGAALTVIGRPPELLRVGASYGAKIVCSNVFIAGRGAQAVLAADVQAPGHPMLKYLKVRVDMQRKQVHADFFGLVGNGLAIYRPGTGCAVVPDGDVAAASRYQYAPRRIWSASPNVPWPTGSMADSLPAVQAVVNDDTLAGAGMRAVVVIERGRLVAQRYGAGFGVSTPLLGWSMTKTVNAAMVGITMAQAPAAPDASESNDSSAPPVTFDWAAAFRQNGFWPVAGDGRAQVTVAQLLSMTSGLRFNESYGNVSDVTRMLYLEPDMAAYAAAQPLAQPPGSAWEYSSGTSVLLSRLWQRAAAGAASSVSGRGVLDLPAGGAGGSTATAASHDAATAPAVLALPHDALFAPLGMSSAIIEADARGNLVGSSYMYATAQDWARFGQFLLQDGVWQGKRILPAGFVAQMQQPVAASGGRYGQGQVWRQGPLAEGESEAAYGLPADTYWLQGHDGQSIAIVPSRDLVVVRLGLTPRALGYRPQALLAAVLNQLDAAPAPAPTSPSSLAATAARSSAF